MDYVLTVALCFAIIWILSKILQRKEKSIKNVAVAGMPPGPEPSSKENGNESDIRDSGGFSGYVTKLHKKYGPIITFTMDRQPVVSIASAELFKQHQQAFDRPETLFTGQMDLIGKNSIQFANGEHGQNLHKALSRPFAYSNCSKYYEGLRNIGRDLVEELRSKPPESHVPILDIMNLLALKGIVLSAFGFHLSNEEADRGIVGFRKFAEDIIDRYQKRSDQEGQGRFIESLFDLGLPDKEHELDNVITFIIGGFHTTGTLMTWMLYYLAINPEIQEKLHQHVVDVLGEREVYHEDMAKLGYMTQVVDETLRVAQLAPYAARSSAKDVELGGYKIPANTPVLFALGCVLADSKTWPSPEKFDPDRFSEENAKSRHPFAFKPFGFAGKRICPGYRFAYVEVAIFMSSLLKSFRFRMVDGQDIKPINGLVTKPSSEVWMILERRS